MIQSFVWNELPFYIFYLLIYRWVYLFIFCHLDQTLIYMCVLNRCIFQFNVRHVVCTLAVSLIYMTVYMYRRQEEISVILFILSYFIIVYEFHRSNCCFILLLYMYMYQLGFFSEFYYLLILLTLRTFSRKVMNLLQLICFWNVEKNFHLFVALFQAFIYIILIIIWFPQIVVVVLFRVHAFVL